MDCAAIRERFKSRGRPCELCCSDGGVWGVLVTTRGPQQPSLEKEAVKPKIERASGIVKSSVGDKTAGELRWEKPNARMGKEITEKYGKHNRTGNGENINRNTIYPVEVQ